MSDPSETDITDKLVPTYSDNKSAIKHDGNNARIPGLMRAVGKYLARIDYLQELFKFRAVRLSNGRLAVDSVQAVTFVKGLRPGVMLR